MAVSARFCLSGDFGDSGCAAVAYATVRAMDVEDVRQRLHAMQGTLAQLAAADSDALVTDIGLSTLKALLAAGMKFVPEDPVLGPVRDFLAREAEGPKHVRAMDALLVVDQVVHALPEPPPMDLRISSGWPGPPSEW
jgi:hypothetical protein